MTPLFLKTPDDSFSSYPSHRPVHSPLWLSLHHLSRHQSPKSILSPPPLPLVLTGFHVKCGMLHKASVSSLQTSCGCFIPHHSQFPLGWASASVSPPAAVPQSICTVAFLVRPIKAPSFLESSFTSLNRAPHHHPH